MIDFHTHTAKPDAIVNAIPSDNEFLYSVGIHPWNTSNFNENQWNEIMHYATMPQVVMIGETGLDKLRGASLDVQQDIFMRHVQLSEQLHKPLLLHCVRAYQEIANLHHSLLPSQPWILHGFRGNEKIAIQLNREGIYLSFGERYNIQALKNADKSMMLIESDDSSKSIKEIYTAIAHDLALPLESLIDIVTNNSKRIIITI